MRIAVVGAGIAGLCTALEMRLAGAEVVVLERGNRVATEGSFGALGVAAPLPPPPWPSPMAPSIPFWHRWGPRRSDIRAWHGASTVARVQQRLIARAPGVRAGQARFDDLRLRYGWAVEPASGVLWPMTTARQVRAAEALLPELRAAGADLVLLGADDARQMDPTLNESTDFLSAWYSPTSQAINVRHVAQHIKDTLVRLGVELRLGQDVVDVDPTAEGVSLSVRTPDPGTTFGVLQPTEVPAHQVQADAVVLCTGATGSALQQACGIRTAAHRITAWTLTAPLRELGIGPRLVVVDESAGVVIARLGARLRASCGIWPQSSATGLDAQECAAAAMQGAIDRWFPGQTRRRESQVWGAPLAVWPHAGPLIGASTLPRVWMNLGHGSDGWALSWFAALTLAQQVIGDGGDRQA